MKKTLLLNTTYEALSFVTEKKLCKLVFKEKVEVISNWSDHIQWINNTKIQHPAIIRLKEPINRKYTRVYFNRRSIIRRDKSICQYCAKKLNASEITIDHIIPRSVGGQNTFTNCVVSCLPCNSKKSNKTPEQAGMKLLRLPYHPNFLLNHDAENTSYWHEDWDSFLPG